MKSKKLILMSSMLVVGLAVLLGCEQNSSTANLTAGTSPAASPAAASPAPATTPEPNGEGKYKGPADVPRISVDDAKKAFDAGTAFFVDSRPAAAYKVEHIKGALNIPNGPEAEKQFSSIPKGKKVIVYCS